MDRRPTEICMSSIAGNRKSTQKRPELQVELPFVYSDSLLDIFILNLIPDFLLDSFAHCLHTLELNLFGLRYVFSCVYRCPFGHSLLSEFFLPIVIGDLERFSL